MIGGPRRAGAPPGGGVVLLSVTVIAAVAGGLPGCGDGGGGPEPLVADGVADEAVVEAVAGLPAAGAFAVDVTDLGGAALDGTGAVVEDDLAFVALDPSSTPTGTSSVALGAGPDCTEGSPAPCRTLGSAAHLVVQGGVDVRFDDPRPVLGMHVAVRRGDVPTLETLEPSQGTGFAFMLPQLRVLVTAIDDAGDLGSTIRAIPASATFRSTEVQMDWLWVDTHRLGEVAGLRIVVDSPVASVDTVLVDNLATSPDYSVDRDFVAFAIIPDTQKYSEDPALVPLFDAQTAWLAENRDDFQIAFASHVGDIVERGDDPEEWVRADAVMARLDGVLPYGLVIGNHDFADWSAPEDGSPLFLETFPESRFSDAPWWGGRSPDGYSSWQRFDTPEGPFLYLHLMVDSPPPTLAWAEGVLDDNPGVPTAVTTHVYLRENGRIPVAYMTATAGTWPGISADQVFEDLIAQHDQIFMVTCGHIAAEHLQVSTNASGQPVYELLQDYQNRVDGGEGFLRLFELYPRRGEIRAVTYSPALDVYEVDADSAFVIDDARIPGWTDR